MEIHKNIKNAILDNNLVVFVGSGLSQRFNLPSWNKLVEDVIKEIDDEKYNVFLPVLKIGSMPPIDVLEILKPEHNLIKRYIKNNFFIQNGDYTLHRKIIELTGQVITTNYDNAFEKASDYKITPAVYTSTFNISEINKDNASYIFKLHGSYSEPDSCIIFKDNYNDLYSKETAAREKLKAIFAEKTILFLGFSFNDPDINLIFSNLDLAFGNNNKHFVLTTESTKFKEYKFLNTIAISNFDSIDIFIDQCINCKKETIKCIVQEDKEINVSPVSSVPNVAFLSPDPLDLDFKSDLSKICDYFNQLEINLNVGCLNLRTLNLIEDYDLLILATKTFKDKLYIEDENLKSDLLSPSEICENIPNMNIPIIFITDRPIPKISDYSYINIASYKKSVISRFVYKTLRNSDLVFQEDVVSVHLEAIFEHAIDKGNANICNIYGNSRDLDIGKKCLHNVIGRIEEQSLIANRILNINKTNRFLNVKASGGVGKTTLVKKVAYELYNRGYFFNGITFKSCESVKVYEDFEDILIAGFNLTNIVDFKEYIVDNYSYQKIDSLIILDNFETVVNTLDKDDFENVIDLLKFSTDYSNIVLTSREKITKSNDFEDIFNLTPLTTDDALELFIKHYGDVTNEEITILRSDILEDLLNNNPLAIKLVTTSRTKFKQIIELKDQLVESFFESTNEDFRLVYKNNADLNIERSKSLFQSINYSFVTLKEREKLAFELLNLFPDGISLSNFKRCFKKQDSNNSINDNELRVLRNKSLVEDYNGTLQLQPIIRRFAEFQFSKRSAEVKQKYCLDAYLFNCFVFEILEMIRNKSSFSEALRLYNNYKNNLLNVLTYMTDIEISENSSVPEKEYLLNFIYDLDNYIVNEKQVKNFLDRLTKLQDYFSDITNAEQLINVLKYRQAYYQWEFDNSYKQLSNLLSVEEMENRNLEEEENISKRYKNLISSIHSMEGYTLQMIKLFVNNNNNLHVYFSTEFFYLGITDNITRKKDGFYNFEYDLMHDCLDIQKLEEYIGGLHLDEHLEIMQSTYTLSKAKKIERKMIKKLVVTNPYTKGLKELMFAFSSKNNEEKMKYYELALQNLSHIKYYYLECLYYYCLFLKETNHPDYDSKLKQGIELTGKFYYQYLNHLFVNIDATSMPIYNFDYSFYPLSSIKEYVEKHNTKWEQVFKEAEIE